MHRNKRERENERANKRANQRQSNFHRRATSDHRENSHWNHINSFALAGIGQRTARFFSSNLRNLPKRENQPPSTCRKEQNRTAALCISCNWAQAASTKRTG